jgi:hypothetical protein
MANPLALIGLGVGAAATVAGGQAQIAGAEVTAESQKLNIQGQMLQTIGSAFGFETQAQQYGYGANIARYQAGVATINKSIAEGNATYAREVGEVEAQQSGMKSRSDLGAMKVAQGASGLDVNYGSSVDVRESMIELGYYSEGVVRSDAARKAYGFEVEATQDQAQADIYRYTAQQNEAQAANAVQGAGIVEEALPMEQQAMALADKAKSIQIAGSIASTTASVASKWIEATKIF